MTRMGFVINLDTCLDHRGCMTACKMYRDTPMGVYHNKTVTSNDNAYPDPNVYFVSVLCQQCSNPACMKACKPGALVKRDDGIVVVADQAACNACGDHACETACPYGAIRYDERTQKTYKCDMCYERIEAGERPRCVAGCLTGSRFYGDFDDEASIVSQIVAQFGDGAHRLKESAGTEPNTYYLLTRKRWDDDKFLYDPNWFEEGF